MVEVYEPVSCERGTYHQMPVWVVRCRDQAGDYHAHAFPDHAPLCRAAELGIDPADVETLLDVILHEARRAPGDPDHDVDLYALPVDEARRMHLARVAHVKRHRVSIDHRHPVFAAFYADHGVTPEAVDALADEVAQLRQVVAATIAHRAAMAATAPARRMPSYLPPEPPQDALTYRPRPVPATEATG